MPSAMPPAQPSSKTITPSPQGSAYIDLYQPYQKIYTRQIKGYYQRLRQYLCVPLLLAYFLLPWLSIDQRPAMLFDLSAQQFHILWATFTPQDGYLLMLLLMLAAFALFASTVVVGRAWCGFTCPQTVWTMIFMWLEEHSEGSRNQRIKLDQQPWTLSKLARKTYKHSLWLMLSLATGLSFVGYFYGIKALLIDLSHFAATLEACFWVLLFTVLTYLNAGWLRDQVCKYMCPYARFQSVMYDQDTLLVTYDQARGENRGPRKAGSNYQAQGLGDCIDCSWCVQVCPVDIDIRNGLQSECIDCGLCIDACDSVMEKMAYDKGLISFSSQRASTTGIKKLWRPRLAGYLMTFIITIALLTHTIVSRVPLSLTITRDRGPTLYTVVGNNIENRYSLKVHHKGQDRQTFLISINGELNYRLKGPQRISIEAGGVYQQAMRIQLPKDELQKTSNRFTITVRSVQDPTISVQKISTFLGPSK
ncbi:cytochrome c oxidase accessory protein CcoG [Dasania sp. GY-MA-18]|uniref:Cytochrome c oxidase accessory protein CcoG n=1 Tax=Dasania phycosphaerae TaxID=2950436 RepID=A0A9J6RQ84_9GAMM|nr:MULTISPECIES: cytochrome c oxidase accessory protein CcoG [Dasania]MCR8923853.1 cytochrome c oxidase accessory protein CcoG [Dasania sp. GY-MA-18]MCZ0866287.1 cytochrome c oxidase accessory protein CcoG [Dasania phycosphaerae]MCZ0870011.1 cytochrome c oxidase accessory protein CcoG [Dasania phycosphaerae]